MQAIAGPPDALSAQGTSVSVAPDPVVAGVIPARFPLLQARRPSAVRAPYSIAFTAQDTEAVTVSLARAFDSGGANSAALTSASTVTSWTWDFGTGETIQTTAPEIEYDFEAHRPSQSRSVIGAAEVMPRPLTASCAHTASDVFVIL